jgi:aquaporin Z
MSLIPKLVTEFVGAFIFMTVIALSGEAGALAPLAIGSGLMVMVYMGGHISGGHYNPAVSFGIYLRRRIGVREMGLYWAAQLLGGILAFIVGYLVSGRAPGIQPGLGVRTVSALTVEALFTMGLVLVVLNVAATKATAGKSFYGLAIGFMIVAAAFVGGPISGGAFNPAVGLGATLAAALFHGGSFGSLWLYVVGPLGGAAIAAGIHAVQLGEVGPQLMKMMSMRVTSR